MTSSQKPGNHHDLPLRVIAINAGLCYYLDSMNHTAAFFDMDYTITWENSGPSSVKFARKHGLVDMKHLVKGIVKFTLYRLSLINVEGWYERNMENISGLPLKDMEHFSSLWFEAMIRNAIYKEAVQYIKDHAERGHRVVIISNAPSFFVQPVADALKVSDVISTRVEVQNGILTGKLIKPLCYGEGKLHYAQAWAELNDIDLAGSYFYTDSYFDLPFMKAVGNPIATNPDRRLR
ncbi:MAG TPA: HAD family hydrolase, partial [Deltaproteobacteria bacterium]|nr:HAD family hydrolase [Deltaproteobacteria bacterium]